jgi:hypothetical protein
MSSVRQALVLVALGFVGLHGCETTRAISPGQYLGYAQSAIGREDWQAAYRLIEDLLISDDAKTRIKAYDLIRQYPQIRAAALQSFSVESLEKTYSMHRDRAFDIEQSRLDIYKNTISTREEYRKALRNYHDTYDSRIRAAQEDKKRILSNILEEQRKADSERARRAQHDPAYALSEEVYECGPSNSSGSIVDLMESLKVGEMSRRHVLAMLGQPSHNFEAATILTWFIRVREGIYSIVPKGRGTGATHSLVLIFNRERVLVEKSFVKILH